MSKQRWLARLSILLMAGALYLLIEFAGLLSFALIGFALAGICVTVACAYWFLSHRGLVRWLALAVAVLAPVAVNVLFARHGVLWVALVVLAALLAAVAIAKAAMGTVRTALPRREHRASRPEHAFLIMNPRSGGGKVGKFGLKEKAEDLGAKVAFIDGPGEVDVAALAEQAVADGADLLGVAGGDGTQALVAGVAAKHSLPFLCISAGTRNHFALDLGLSREDPAAGLEALTDGVERRIDLGLIGERTFVNNASFGVYAEIVRSPAYRDDKRGTTLQMLPDLMRDDGEQNKLTASANGIEIRAPQAVLVSNNPYELSDIAGLGRRERLDRGTLGLIAVKVDNAAQAIGLVRAGPAAAGLTVLTAREVVIGSAEPSIPVGIDGETVLLPAPVHCSIQPGALRVVVPRHSPGVPAARPALNWGRLAHLAGFSRSRKALPHRACADLGLLTIVR
ncbi:MAG TPA: diacylglycerol kinase family protein [Streptosporangiaceae bacterium]|nr:diacylglycerol kinase family protein [Streptosporangiaceae bacterium]